MQYKHSFFEGKGTCALRLNFIPDARARQHSYLSRSQCISINLKGERETS